MSQTHAHEYEVAILGGGPAGATAAAALARKGRRVALLEPDNFPRFHIGESLLSNANAVFRAIGLHPAMHGSAFTKKYGARFLTADGSKDVLFDFTANPKIPEPQTFQVCRADIDLMLLEHAVACGAERLQVRAKEVAITDAGVTIHCDPERTLRAQAVIDATGRAGLLARKFGLRERDPDLEKLAVHAHFQGVPRDEGPRGGDIRIVSHQELGWAWLIPLADGVMSVGFVLELSANEGPGKRPPERLLHDLLADWPVLRRLTAQATRTTPVRVESSFSYRTRRYAGRRFLLAGDAGSFLDPVFSSGVMFALHAGLKAAEALDAALGAGRIATEGFGAYDRSQRERYELVRKFVVGFYRPNFRDFFFAPTRRFGLVQAVTAVLGGFWEPSAADRLRLATLFGLAQLQRVVRVVPRVHTPVPAP